MTDPDPAHAGPLSDVEADRGGGPDGLALELAHAPEPRGLADPASGLERRPGPVEQDVSSDTDTALFIRFGVAQKLSSGAATLGQTDVLLQVGYESCGALVGSATLALKTRTTEDCFTPVSQWLPAMTVDRIMAAIVATSESGEFRCRLAYRTASASKNVASAWSTTFDAWHTGPGEWNTGLLTPVLANDMWVQVGIQYALATGTALGQATVSVAAAVRKV